MMKMSIDKKKALVVAGKVAVGFMAVYGIVAAYNYGVAFTGRKLDEFAVNRVNTTDELKVQFVSQVREEVAVPVVKEADVKAQVEAAIRDQLKQ